MPNIRALIIQIKHIKNIYQLAAFIITACLLIIIILASDLLLRVLAIISICIALLFILPFFNQFMDYLKSKDWNKRTNEYLQNQDPTKSPAYIAASEHTKNIGKVSSYNHILKEIEELEKEGKSDKEIISKLKERVRGSINTLG